MEYKIAPREPTAVTISLQSGTDSKSAPICLFVRQSAADHIRENPLVSAKTRGRTLLILGQCVELGAGLIQVHGSKLHTQLDQAGLDPSWPSATTTRTPCHGGIGVLLGQGEYSGPIFRPRIARVRLCRSRGIARQSAGPEERVVNGGRS